MDTNNQSIQPPEPGQGWSRRIVLSGVVVAVVAGIGVAGAASGEFGRGGGFGGHMIHARMGGGFAEYRLEQALKFVDATPEQIAKVKAIFDAARGEIMPIAQGFRGTHEDVAEILGAPAIDRTAAETLRSERMAVVEAASQRVTTAFLDAAEVLTAEQREKLVEHFNEHGPHRRW